MACLIVLIPHLWLQIEIGISSNYSKVCISQITYILFHSVHNRSFKYVCCIQKCTLHILYLRMYYSKVYITHIVPTYVLFQSVHYTYCTYVCTIPKCTLHILHLRVYFFKVYITNIVPTYVIFQSVHCTCCTYVYTIP